MKVEVVKAGKDLAHQYKTLVEKLVSMDYQWLQKAGLHEAQQMSKYGPRYSSDEQQEKYRAMYTLYQQKHREETQALKNTNTHGIQKLERDIKAHEQKQLRAKSAPTLQRLEKMKKDGSMDKLIDTLLGDGVIDFMADNRGFTDRLQMASGGKTRGISALKMSRYSKAYQAVWNEVDEIQFQVRRRLVLEQGSLPRLLQGFKDGTNVQGLPFPFEVSPRAVHAKSSRL